MECRGKFKFKQLVRREGGEFKNSKGDIISYKESYALKVDELTDNGIYERTFKIPVDSEIVQELLIKKPYSDITLVFDIIFYGNSIKAVPTAVE